MNPGRGRGGAVRVRAAATGGGFTLVELIIVVAIIGILALIAVPNFQAASVRAKVVAAKAGLKTLGNAIEIYRTDRGAMPQPSFVYPGDPNGILADSALSALTTPVAYLSSLSCAKDPFGAAKIQGSVPGAFDANNVPGEDTFNPTESLLFFSYPNVASLVGRPALDVDAYALVSLGPDGRDSFILYHPFPGEMPTTAAGYGARSIQDTIYDPTNGATSFGDIARFGGVLDSFGTRGGGAD